VRKVLVSMAMALALDAAAWAQTNLTGAPRHAVAVQWP